MSKLPALKALVFAFGGFFAGTMLRISFTELLVFAFTSLLVSFLLLTKHKKIELAFLLICVTIGIVLNHNLQNVRIDRPNKLITEMKSAIEGEVINITKRDSNGTTCIIVGSIDTPQLPRIADQRIYLRIIGDGKKPNAGTYIRAYGKIRLPEGRILPNDFSEDIYFAGQNVQWIAYSFAQDVSWLNTDKNIYYWREHLANDVKSKCDILFQYDQNAIVKAVLLGDQSTISPELRQVYSLSGTAHVLSLSGLHVGVIAFIIFTFLNFFKSQWFKFTAFVVLIFAFIFLTGFQPPAVRSAFMAVLFVLATILQRKANPLNIISFVVLISVIFEPALIYSAGFQMSVASIIGIVVLFTPTLDFLNRLFPSKNKLLEYLKNSVAITIAASAVVSPIVAFYFGIYSIVSLLTNIIIIPLISFSVVLSVITLGLSYLWFGIASIFADATTFCLLLSERINQFAVSLPLAYIEGEVSFIISIFILFAVIYTVTSKNLNQTLFRLTVSIAVISIGLLFFKEEESYKMQIYPRKQMTVALFPSDDNQTFVYLADRKPSQLPRTDYKLIEYLESLDDSLTIAVNGNAGINTADFLRERKPFRYIELPPNFQKSLELRIFGDKKLSQIIETDYEN